MLCDLSFVKIEKNLVPRCAILHVFTGKISLCKFYSHASKTASNVSCTAHGPNFTASRTMNVNTSIFTVEACAVFLVTSHVIEQYIPRSVIYTHYLSVMRALSPANSSENQVINRVLKTIISAYALNLELAVCRVPGHSGIVGNETADQMATAAAL